MPGDLHWSITESDRPRGNALANIEARRDHLRSFPPCAPETAKAMISRLFLRFPQMSKASEEQVTCYARDLAPFPLWAISRGLNDIVAGDILRAPEFPPSSIQVRSAVEKAADPVREELVAIDMVLTAKVIADADTAPDVEKRKAMAERLREQLRAAMPTAPPPRPRDTRLPSSFDAAREAVPKDLTLSDAARVAAGYASRKAEA